jgi:hypothetical protein
MKNAVTKVAREGKQGKIISLQIIEEVDPEVRKEAQKTGKAGHSKE